MKKYKYITTGKIRTRVLALLLLCGMFLFSSFRQMCPRTLPFLDTNLAEGQALAKKHNRILFVFIYGKHCLKSKRMVNESFADTSVIRLYSNAFVCIKMNPDQIVNNYKLTNRGMTVTPSFLFYSPEKVRLYKTEGYKGHRILMNMAEIALRKMERMRVMEARVKRMDCDGSVWKKDK